MGRLGAGIKYARDKAIAAVVTADHVVCQFVLTKARLSGYTDSMDLSETPGTRRAESPDISPSDDPAAGLRAVLALRRLAERVEAEQVARARTQGWSWQQIAEGLGMTRQSVHAKYGGGL